MKKTVYLHIGYLKTGTTAIQNFLFNHKSELLNCGVLYPETFSSEVTSHHLHYLHIANDCKDSYLWGVFPKMSRAEVWDSFRKEFDESKAMNAIISCEDLIRYSDRDNLYVLKNLKDELKGYNVRVICYVRRQDDFIESLYGQRLKGFAKWPKLSFKMILNHFRPCIYFYYSALKSWEKYFGRKNIIVRSFDEEISKKGILYSFLDIFDCTKILKSERRDNSSLNKTYIGIKRVINKLDLDDDLNQRINDLFKLPSEQKSRLLSLDDRKTLLRYCSKENDKLFKRYLNSKCTFPVINDDNYASSFNITESIVKEIFSKDVDLALNILTKLLIRNNN